MQSAHSRAEANVTAQGRQFRTVLVVTGFVLAALSVPATLAGVVYYTWIAPTRKLMDAAWLQNASPAEQRAVAHRILRWGRGGGHDEFIILNSHGNAESIPLLIDALRAFPDTDGVMVCSKAHCLSALTTITGHNAGNNHKDWADWWNTVGRKIPPTAFPLKRPTTSTAPVASRPQPSREP